MYEFKLCTIKSNCFPAYIYVIASLENVYKLIQITTSNMRVSHIIVKYSKLVHTLLCWEAVGVIGGVSVTLGDNRPSVDEFEHGSLCS